MIQEEGIIKFRMHHTERRPLPESMIREVNQWRSRLFAAQLIGQDPSRYGGYGFGNISQRVGPPDTGAHPCGFVITGSQTGGIVDLTVAHFALVVEAHPDRNTIVSEGPVKPSSESMTHATLYALDHRLMSVMHVHAPAPWRQAQELELPMTRPDVPYGSPEMSREVRRLFAETDVYARGVFAMGGHQDGLVAFGTTAAKAGGRLLSLNERALELRARQS